MILGVIKERGGMRERRRLVLRGEPSRRSPLLLAAAAPRRDGTQQTSAANESSVSLLRFHSV